MMLKLSDFDYNLPKELIAQFPVEKRDESRLLVLDRKTGKIEHRVFRDIVEYLNLGDALVLNDTKVIPARLIGRKETGGRLDILILNVNKEQRAKSTEQRAQSKEQKEYEVLVKPLKRVKVGSNILFGNGELKADITRIDNGRIFLKLHCNGNLNSLLNKFGEMPLPPYIKREPINIDRKRYQTVYARKEGAIAAPTAGLHFTESLLRHIREKNINIEYVTLHVGYGTFKPVKCDNISQHKIEEEYLEVSKKVMERLKEIKKRGGRVFAVGTTTCRVLETICHYEPNRKQSQKSAMTDDYYQGWTDLFIYPPYKFKFVDALITNFHLPKTTLLMLVSAFCGKDLLFRAYREAIERRYRFYSYGDAMLIL